MQNQKVIKSLSVLFLAVTSFSVMAQDSTSGTMKTSKSFSTFSIGLNAGVLTPSVPIGGSNNFTNPEFDLGYGLYIKDQINHWIALQADFLRGNIKGDNSEKLGNGSETTNPYKSFKTDLNWSGSISGLVTFGNINWLNLKNFVVPYVSAGAGIAAYKPKLITGNGNTILYKQDDKDIKEFFVPVGGGLKFIASQAVNVDLGFRMNFLDADNLDGYPVPTYHKDKFSYAFAGVEFAFGSKKHPQLIADNPVADFKQDLMDRNNALRASLAASEQQNANTIDSLNGVVSRLKTDADKDGVSDYFDKCPNTSDSDKVDGSGCPLPKMAPPPPVVNKTYIISEEEKRTVAEAVKDLQFEFGKSTIKAVSYPSLDRVAQLLETKSYSLKLAGYTDAVGSVEKNLQLSKDRANAVKDYLVSKGTDASKIPADGFGKSNPVACNKTAAGRAKNRRVEFTLF